VNLRRLHLLVGLATVALFGLTGLYMHYRYDHLRGMTDATRLLFRSTHIYLLLSGLLNVALGLYLPEGGRPDGSSLRDPGPATTIRAIGSGLVLLGPLLFLAGFLREPFLGGLARPFTRPAVYAALAGIALHLASSRTR
jgi:MFS superfamily sulfate permease-like transporter